MNATVSQDGLTRSRRRRDLRSRVAALGLCLLPGLVAAPPSLPELEIRAGLMSSAFAGVNTNDAEAAFKVFVEQLGTRNGYRAVARTTTYEQLPELRRALQEGEVNILLVNGWDYLELEAERWTPALLTAGTRAGAGHRYLLLSGPTVSGRTLEALRGRSVGLLRAANGALGEYWLAGLLRARGAPPAKEYFREVRVEAQVSRLVLGVFFGKLDACVVTREGFETMAELNPQLGRRLQVVAESPPLADGLVCVSRGGWPSEKHRADLVRVLANLGDDPAGRQLMMLFRVERLWPFAPDHLDGVRDLRRMLQAARTATSISPP